MAISINGTTGVITGVSEGGLPDGSVNTADIKDLSITGDKLGTGSVSTDKIDSGAVTSAKLDSGVTSSIDAKAPLSQPEFTGNYVKVPVGDTASRPSAQAGMIRFNTDTNSMEQYDGSNWTTMAKPPIISSLSYPGSQTAVSPDGGETITISGANFTSGVNVKFGDTYATSVTRTNSTSLSVVVPALTVDTYDVIVENSDGMQATLSGGIESNAAPVFTTTAGSLGSIQLDQSMTTITIVATEDDSGAITYAVTTGALPTGVSLSGADISGTPTGYTAETTSNFTITATDDEGQTTSRAFSLTVLVGFYSYEIDQSLLFNDDDSDYLSWTPSSAGNRKTWTWSGWVKRSTLKSSGYNHMFGYINSGNTERTDLFFYNDSIYLYCKVSDVSVGYIRTNALYRDTSSWYHIMGVVDTTESTSSNRLKLYVNGEQITSLAEAVYPSQNTDLWVNAAVSHKIGKNDASSSQYFDGYMAEINFIDGTALSPTAFGESKEGVWIPKEYSSSYGTNGFYLKFVDGAINQDSSGNGNNFTTSSNLGGGSVRLDSPTNNFAVINPLEWYQYSGTFSHGNTHWETNTTSGDGCRNLSSYWPSSGKYYYEIELENTDVSGYNYLYINPARGTYLWLVYGSQYEISGTTGTTSISYPSDGSILQIAIDCDAGKTWYGLNNTWYTTSGTPDPAAGTGAANTSYANEQWGLTVNGRGTGSTAQKLNINFGQDSSFNGNKTAQGNADGNGYGDFYYEPPTGFLALCNANLPDDATFELDTGEKPSDHFNVVTYTGTGATQSITGVGFQPDWVWIKNRDSGSDYHNLYDSVRGTNLRIYSNGTNAEEAGHLDSFDTDGFTLNTSNSNVNGSGTSYVAWCWKAGGTAVSNTNGSITSSVSANTTAGFSIVGYTGNGTTGATIGHGLSKTPEAIFVKNRSATYDWIINFGTDFGHIKFTTDSSYVSSSYQHIVPTNNSILTCVSNIQHINASGNDYICYAFHSVDGFSKIGSYTGNGSTDGPFVYTGFRPACIIYKRTDSSADWHIYDNKRDTYNVADSCLFPSGSYNDQTGDALDFLSNGFKQRNTGSEANASGGSYIYMAFAEDPFKYGNAR